MFEILTFSPLNVAMPRSGDSLIAPAKRDDMQNGSAASPTYTPTDSPSQTMRTLRFASFASAQLAIESSTLIML